MNMLKRILFALLTIIVGISIVVIYPISVMLTIPCWILTGKDIMLTQDCLDKFADKVDSVLHLDKFFDDIKI